MSDQPVTAVKPGSHRGHGQITRGLRDLPRSPMFEGRFGRLFRKLDPLVLEDSVLEALAAAMQEGASAGGGWNAGAPAADEENPAIPAGFTYLGQFIDHDITFDPASSLQRRNDPDALVSFRSPRFDLDSLYGSGRHDEPFQYDQESGGVKFLIENNKLGVPDLPRNSQGTALIGDPRNDENIIVSQLHFLFLRFHNRVIDKLSPEGLQDDELFDEAQQIVRWHYQWIVVHDFLPRLIGAELANDLLAYDEKKQSWDATLRWYRARVNAFMPLEFSAAAYRFGHSQIRPTYDLNPAVRQIPIFSPSEPAPELGHLGGFRLLPPAWSIDWSFFFGDGATAPNVQPSRKINSRITDALTVLPSTHGATRMGLAIRNLLRGRELKLPSGQRVAAAMKAKPLTENELGLSHESPLWHYVLKEAEVQQAGTRLGEVGGRIVGGGSRRLADERCTGIREYGT